MMSGSRLPQRNPSRAALKPAAIPPNVAIARSVDIASDEMPRALPRAPMKRSEEHTSELQSLLRISYAVSCLKKKTHIYTEHTTSHPLGIDLTPDDTTLHHTNRHRRSHHE